MDVTIDNVKFTEDDIINADEYEYFDTLHIIHECGFIICAVCADTEQDALDEAVNQGKMDHFLIEGDDLNDYGIDTDNPTCTFLGNAGEPFDIENVSMFSVQMPKMSITILLNAMFDDVTV